MNCYAEGELEQLHAHLYDILSQTIEVCERLGIAYFLIGGSAIGALFDGAILEWDDDIDLGMERADYERFISEGGQYLAAGYAIQSPENEDQTPYYFAKVRKDGTLFEGFEERGLRMHKGVYIDIFPFDRVPDSPLAERAQRFVVRQLTNAFVATRVELREGSALRKAIVNLFARVVGRRLIYRMLKWAQRLFNGAETRCVNIVYMPLDHIERSTLHPTQEVGFGALRVRAPQELERYLNRHYPNLHRHEADEQINHKPSRLKL